MNTDIQLMEDDLFFEITRRYDPASSSDTHLAYPRSDFDPESSSLDELVRQHPDYSARLVEFAALHFGLIETPLEDEVREAIDNYDLSLERRILARAFARHGLHTLMDYDAGREKEVQPVFSTAEWNRLLSQIGYGNPKAPLWFLGMEEGLDKGYPIEMNLRWRLDKFAQPFDNMSNHLQAPWILKDATGAPILPRTQTWPTMAKIARYVDGAHDWQDLGQAKNFVRTQLGTESGRTLLLELLPLPMSRHSGWLDIFNEYFPGGLAAFKEEMLPRRIALLRDLVMDHKPARIIGYGKKNWQYYEEIFPEIAWTHHELDDKAWAKKGRLGVTTVVLTPFFGVGALSNQSLTRICALLGLRETQN